MYCNKIYLPYQILILLVKLNKRLNSVHKIVQVFLTKILKLLLHIIQRTEYHSSVYLHSKNDMIMHFPFLIPYYFSQCIVFSECILYKLMTDCIELTDK